MAVLLNKRREEVSPTWASGHYAHPGNLECQRDHSRQLGQPNFQFPNAKAQGCLPSVDFIQQQGEARHPQINRIPMGKITLVNSFFLARKIQNMSAPPFIFKAMSLLVIHLKEISSWSSSQDGGISRNPPLSSTAKRKITTNIKSINNQKHQNQTAWNSNNQGIKKKSTRTTTPVRWWAARAGLT